MFNVFVQHENTMLQIDQSSENSEVSGGPADLLE
jgi:hypothetical protein